MNKNNCNKKMKEEYGQLHLCFPKGFRSEVIVLVTKMAAALLSYEAPLYSTISCDLRMLLVSYLHFTEKETADHDSKIRF